MNSNIFELLFAYVSKVNLDLVILGFMEEIDFSDGEISCRIVGDGIDVTVFMIEDCLFMLGVSFPLDIFHCVDVNILANGQQLHDVVSFLSESW